MKYSATSYLRDRQAILSEIATFQSRFPKADTFTHNGYARLASINREYREQFTIRAGG